MWLRGAYSHVLLEARLKDSHGGQTTRSHGNIRKFVGGTVGSNSEKMRTGRIDTTENEMGTNMSLIPGCQLGLALRCERKLT
jgi:hypothetical protein